MQRRVDEPDRRRQPVHRGEQVGEVLDLGRQQLGERRITLLIGLGEHDPLDLLTSLAEELVLRAAQADALGAAVAGALGVLAGVGIGPHPQPAAGVGVGEHAVDRLEQLGGLVPVGRGAGGLEALGDVGHDGGVDDVHVTEEDLTGLAVDGDGVALADDVLADPDLLARHVDDEVLRADDRALAHAAGDDGRVRGLAAARGEDAGGGDHAGQVLGGGLATHEDHRAALGLLGLGARVVEGDGPDGRTRGGAHAGGDEGALGLAVELREEQLAQLLAGDPLEGLVHRDERLVDELGRDAEGGTGGALADAGLQHPQPAALDGELDVAQVAVVRLEAAHRGAQLLVGVRVALLEVGERERVADARDDVLALGIGQVVAVDAGVAGGGVAGEAHARAGGLAEVAEDHRLHVDRGAQVVGDALAATVELGALGVPAAEDRLDGHVHLTAGRLREGVARLVEDDLLELGDDLLEVVGGQVDVGLNAGLLLVRVEDVAEALGVDVEHRLAEHLDEPAVGVPREALVTGEGGEGVDGVVVEADVEHRLHHAGHGELRAGAHREQERLLGVAEGAADEVLDVTQSLGDLDAHLRGHPPLGEVGAAGLRRDREAGRDGQAQLDHLGEVGPLAAEEVLLVAIALAEHVDVLNHRVCLPKRVRGTSPLWQASPPRSTVGSAHGAKGVPRTSQRSRPAPSSR